MYSLDSDTVNGLFRANPNIVRRVRAVNPINLWICTIVIEELVGKQVSHINTRRSQRKPLERESRFLADLIKAFSSF